MAHYDIFRHHIVIKFPAYGHALWDPDPGNLYPAVEVGDVGYIHEGKFHRLFNVLLPAEDESHADFGVPENYEQLELNLKKHINISKLSRNNFCSAKVVSMPESERLAQGPDEIRQVSFSCPMKEGAVLYLPIEATGENTVKRTDFGKWIIKHIDVWFPWARRLGLGIDRMEDLILVTGTHRTRSWTNIAFPGGQEDAQAQFGAKADRRDGVITINWQFSHESSRGVVLNCGPDGKNLPEDQCIFIRGFRVTRKLRILPPRLKGAAEPSSDPEGHDDESVMELIPTPSVPEYRDPLLVLLEYIAEEAPPYCDSMLLVHDDDLARLDEVYDRTPLDTVLSHIRGLKPTVHSVRIDPKDISSARNSASADTESAWVATLSNIFEKQSLLSTSSASQSLHVKTPFPDPSPVAIAREYHDVRQVLGSAQFRHLYGDKGARIVSGEGFFLASNNDVESQRDRAEVLRVLRSSPEQADQIAQYFYEKTRELINIKSYSLNDKNVKYVDIVCDVLRYMPLHWAATELAGLTLKADSESLGDYTEPELYEMITDIYSLLFLDVDPSKAMNIEARAKENIKGLQRHIKANILADVGGKLSISNLVGTIQSLFNAKAKKQRLSVAESLFESGASADRSTNNVLSLLVGASVELSQSLINIVNFYIDKPNIVEQLRAADAKNPALEAYIYEAMRIDPPFRGVYRESLADQTVGSIAYFKGQRVFLDLTHASHDPNVFPEPHTVNVKRESKDRYLTGDGVTRSLGVDLTAKIMGQVLRAVFEVNGMRRTPGLSGHLKRHKVAAENTLRHEYLGADYLPTAWPNTMVLQYDVAAPQVNGS